MGGDSNHTFHFRYYNFLSQRTGPAWNLYSWRILFRTSKVPYVEILIALSRQGLLQTPIYPESSRIKSTWRWSF
jgi:hypothetical protein